MNGLPLAWPAVAIDIGSYAVRMVERDQHRLRIRSQRAMYAVAEDSDDLRSALQHHGIAFSVAEDGLIVPGDAARPVSLTYGCPIVRPFQNGTVPSGDPISRQVLAVLVDSLLAPSPNTAVCGITTSAHDEQSLKFFEGLVHLRGYEPYFMPPAAAAGCAALDETSLSGVVVDAGASTVEIAVLLAGQPLVTRIIERGGFSVDDEFFLPEEHLIRSEDGSTFRDYEASRELREAYSSVSTSEPARARLAGHRELAAEVARNVIQCFEEAQVIRPFRRPTAVSLCGGLALDRFFAEAVSQSLVQLDTAAYFDRPISTSQDEYDPLRGLLLACESAASFSAPAARAA